MDIIELQRATVAEHIRQENDHNWPAVYDTFVQDDSAFYDVVPLHTHFAGFGGVKDFYVAADAAFPDFRVDVWAEYDVPGCSIREVTISGTHKGEWCGIGGTNKHIKFHLAAMYLFGAGEQAGKLLAERIYFDNETIMRQINGDLDASSIPDFRAAQAAAAARPA